MYHSSWIVNSLYSLLSRFSSLGKSLRLVASALSDAITSPDCYDVITAQSRAQVLTFRNIRPWFQATYREEGLFCIIYKIWCIYFLSLSSVPDGKLYVLRVSAQDVTLFLRNGETGIAIIQTEHACWVYMQHFWDNVCYYDAIIHLCMHLYSCTDFSFLWVLLTHLIIEMAAPYPLWYAD